MKSLLQKLLLLILLQSLSSGVTVFYCSFLAGFLLFLLFCGFAGSLCCLVGGGGLFEFAIGCPMVSAPTVATRALTVGF